jgi:DeoR/GlpR family transcriptional regulator of sugar metabolism
MFNVSEETIRRDLNELQQSGYIEKNYGGAVAVKELHRIISNVPSVQQRKFDHLKEKDVIGKHAAGLVEDGMRIFIDAGSTTWSMLRYLKTIENLAIVTNSVDVAYECAEKHEWDIYVLGGQLITKSMCMVGPDVERQLENINVDIAFIGASGIHENGSCTSSNLFEANVKRKLIGISDRAVITADHSKFGIGCLYTFAKLNDIDTMITSDLLDPRVEESLSFGRCKLIRSILNKRKCVRWIKSRFFIQHP